jgi:hypothetical protein
MRKPTAFEVGAGNLMKRRPSPKYDIDYRDRIAKPIGNLYAKAFYVATPSVDSKTSQVPVGFSDSGP